MTNDLIERLTPSHKAIELVAKIPYKQMQQIRMYHMETSDQEIYACLENIGIDAICQMVSEGSFVYDIASSLDIPVSKIHQWLELEPSRLQAVLAAEEYSAEYYLSLATKCILEVNDTDTDHAKVAKMQADHLKWLAARKDKQKYGDQRAASNLGPETVHFHINISPPSQNKDTTIIDI